MRSSVEEFSSIDKAVLRDRMNRKSCRKKSKINSKVESFGGLNDEGLQSHTPLLSDAIAISIICNYLPQEENTSRISDNRTDDRESESSGDNNHMDQRTRMNLYMEKLRLRYIIKDVPSNYGDKKTSNNGDPKDNYY